MKKIIVGSIAIAMLLTSGCGAAVQQPGPIASVEALVGTWRRTTDIHWYLQFREDGSAHIAPSHENVEAAPMVIWKEYWFEGTQFFLEQAGPFGCGEITGGIYEVDLLENGNLMFVAIDDDCSVRRSMLEGDSDDELTTEWEPIP